MIISGFLLGGWQDVVVQNPQVNGLEIDSSELVHFLKKHRMFFGCNLEPAEMILVRLVTKENAQKVVQLELDF